MSTTNENILKSLSLLEQNLIDINSAKEQVNDVVKSSGNLAEILVKYQLSFEGLSKNVKSVLDDSRKFNLDSIEKLSVQTENISAEIAKLTEFDISKSLKSIEIETIKHFQQNLSKPLEGLDNQIKKIENEVSKLTEHDFNDSFSNIEKQVIGQFNANLKEKLVGLDNKILDLQSKIDLFKSQIIQLETFDLDSKFNNILSALALQFESQSSKLSLKYEEVKNLNHNINVRLNKQEEEMKILKNLIFLMIGILIIGLSINYFL